MANIHQGDLNGQNLNIGIAVSRFNGAITERLLSGALDRFKRLGVADGALDVVWTPGAFELPQTLHALDQTQRFDGLCALGCVIRGDTPHFDHVAYAASQGLTRLSLSTKTAIAFGVLTCDTVEQAQARAGVKSNKGAEVAESLIELIRVLAKVQSA